MAKDKSACYPRVVGYTPPLYHRFVLGMANHTGQSTSEVVVECIKKVYDSMPPQERERILKEGDK